MTPKLLIVTDLGLLKAYKLTVTPRGSFHLDRLETVVLEEAHRRVIDKVTDMAGRRAAPTQKNWAAPVADAHNLKLEIKRRLVKTIVEKIQRLITENNGCGIRLAANREINHLIMSSLPYAARHRIEMNLTRDLVKADERELCKCFAPEILLKKPVSRRAVTPGV